eukprot:241585_1
MSNDDTFDEYKCQRIIEDVVNIENNDVQIEFTWETKIDVHNIAATFELCSHKSETIHLKTRANTTQNSVIIKPNAKIVASITIPSEFETQFQKHANKTKADTRYYGRRIVFNFILSYSEKLFVPDILLFLIFKYIEEAKETTIADLLNKPVEEAYNFTRSDAIRIGALHRLDEENVFAELCKPDTKIVFDSSLKICHGTEAQYDVDTFGDAEVVAILTTNKLYCIWSRNYAIWRQFKEKSKIGELLAYHENIEEEIAAQIAKNLDIVDTRITSSLIGLTKERIFLSILFAKSQTLSLTSLFGDVHAEAFMWYTKHYSIWKQFKNISRIDELINDNTKINKTTAAQIENNISIFIANKLRIAGDEEIICSNLNLASRLIGLTRSSLKLNTLFPKTYSASFESWLGFPACKTKPHSNAAFVRKVYFAMIHCKGGNSMDSALQRSPLQRQCKVMDVMDINIEKRDYGLNMNNYFLEMNSNNLRDAWIEHLDGISHDKNNYWNEQFLDGISDNNNSDWDEQYQYIENLI